MHVAGKKADYNFRVTGMHRAIEAGINDVGIGALLGLYDYRFEVLSMLQHVKDLEDKYGVGPHTISVPRIEPACGSPLSEHPPYAVSDEDFKKIIAVLRLAIPYTGIILSTRENADMRRAAFELGISQISGGSKTNPGYIPSFCTGCYRLGRVGKDFMDLAKPGLIKAHCLPNAMFTFAEYLYDFASEDLKARGLALIEKMMKDLPPARAEQTKANLEKVAKGERDIYF